MICEKIQLDTSAHTEIHDISKKVQGLLNQRNIKDGLVLVRTLHTTAAVCINENESGLLKDTVAFLERIIPKNDFYNHDDYSKRTIPEEDKYKRANAFSHLRAMLLGSEVVVPVIDGKISLGRWQSIFFVELDGPRKKRNVEVIIS
jgi:secondary thiamine-phosphate synthase enzyme